jgi:hypothetical protein
MVSVPAGKFEVVIVTVPVGLTVPEPSGTPPLVSVTVPVAPAGTVAVIVTGAPYVLGPEVVTVTVGVVFETVTEVAGEVAGLLFVSPGVEAVIESVPGGSAEVVSVAVPATIGAVPSSVVPL